MYVVTKICLAVILFLTISNLVYSQSPPVEQAKSNPSGNIIYIKVFGGYGFITPGSTTINSSTRSVGGGANSSFTNSNVGLGAGLHFGGGLGVILNDFLNVGVDAEYLKGEDLSITTTYSNSPYYSTSTQLLTHSIVSVIPNITFKAFSKPNYYFYNRIGIVVAFATNLKSTSKDSTYDASAGNTYVYLTNRDQKFSYNVNIGAQVAFGIQFRISEILRGYGEITGNYLPASPASSVSKFTYQDFTNGLMTGNSNYVYNYAYTKSGSNDYQSSVNGNTTTTSETLPKITHNINYIGLNIGLVLRL